MRIMPTSLRTKFGHATTIATAAVLTVAAVGSAAPAAAQEKKPNILFIMGDDIGLMQVGAYHQGWALGETPNIDRLAKEGGKFTDYYAMQSCTSGSERLLHRHVSAAHGHDPSAASREPVLS